MNESKCAIEYYSVFKTKEILPFTMVWGEPGGYYVK
jgi:hypothetical protein